MFKKIGNKVNNFFKPKPRLAVTEGIENSKTKFSFKRLFRYMKSAATGFLIGTGIVGVAVLATGAMPLATFGIIALANALVVGVPLTIALPLITETGYVVSSKIRGNSSVPKFSKALSSADNVITPAALKEADIYRNQREVINSNPFGTQRVQEEESYFIIDTGKGIFQLVMRHIEKFLLMAKVIY